VEGGGKGRKTVRGGKGELRGLGGQEAQGRRGLGRGGGERTGVKGRGDRGRGRGGWVRGSGRWGRGGCLVVKDVGKKKAH